MVVTNFFLDVKLPFEHVKRYYTSNQHTQQMERLTKRYMRFSRTKQIVLMNYRIKSWTMLKIGTFDICVVNIARIVSVFRQTVLIDQTKIVRFFILDSVKYFSVCRCNPRRCVVYVSSIPRFAKYFSRRWTFRCENQLKFNAFMHAVKIEATKKNLRKP